MPDCFLCSPDPSLIYAETSDCFALAGLGPIVPGYTVVSIRSHIASAADAHLHIPSLTAFTGQLRARLDKLYGPCLLTEHGRVPVCTSSIRLIDSHCLHAHFLVFPDVPDIQSHALSYFAHCIYCDTLPEILQAARGQNEYFLFSPTDSRYALMTRPGRLIPQFARWIVAESIGRPELTNWKAHPNLVQAQQTAAYLRDAL